MMVIFSYIHDTRFEPYHTTSYIDKNLKKLYFFEKFTFFSTHKRDRTKCTYSNTNIRYMLHINNTIHNIIDLIAQIEEKIESLFLAVLTEELT